jgi:hypothetical protein
MKRGGAKVVLAIMVFAEPGQKWVYKDRIAYSWVVG